MDKLNKKLRALLLTGILLAAMFVCGIPMIVLGFTHGPVIVAILGIIGVVAGFYGTAFPFIAYGKCRSVAAVVRQVNNEIYATVDIARNLGKSEKQTVELLQTALTEGYLSGFVLYNGTLVHKGEETFAAAKAMQSGALGSVKCPNCGADVRVIAGKSAVCTYCGSHINTRPHN